MYLVTSTNHCSIGSKENGGFQPYLLIYTVTIRLNLHVFEIPEDIQ